ncbi:MAG: signal peptidase II [Clostridia bacterium]|nr:signal peptidase II [Clostridia bacterium]
MIKKFDETFIRKRVYDYNKCKHLIIYISLVIFSLTFDIVTKNIFTNQYFTLIEDILSISSARNYGGVMGSLHGYNAFLTNASFLVLCFLIYVYFWRYNKTYSFTIGMGIALGAGMGNLADRIFLGYVRDFVRIDCLPSLGSPIFNMADLLLTIGVIIMLYYFMFVAIRIPYQEVRNAKIEDEQKNLGKSENKTEKSENNIGKSENKTEKSENKTKIE